MRIDKYLWCVRVYKTRALATKACKTDRISIDDASAKPSRSVKVGEIILVRKKGIYYQYKVKALPKNRVGAKLAPDYVEDLTPDSEKEKERMIQARVTYGRARGTGRPTKKDRRALKRYTDE